MKTDELIAEFMEESIDTGRFGENWKKILDMKNVSNIPPYNTSWDWLMPVVEKIESLYFYVEIKGNDCYITETGGEDDRVHPWLKEFKEIYCDRGSKIKSTYEAIIQFIKWYNAQPK